MLLWLKKLSQNGWLPCFKFTAMRRQTLYCANHHNFWSESCVLCIIQWIHCILHTGVTPEMLQCERGHSKTAFIIKRG